MRGCLTLGLILFLVLACGKPEPTPEEIAAGEFARSGDRIPLLCGTATRNPDTEAGREAFARLDAMRATAKKELAASAEARGTHPLVRALLDDFIDLHPCPILTAGLRGYADSELDGPGLYDDKLGKQLPERFESAVKSLAPTWLGGEGVIRGGGEGEAVLIVSYTFRPDGQMAMQQQRGLLVVPRVAADLKIYARHPDGREVREQIGTIEIPDEFSFTDTVVRGQELTKGAAVRAQESSLRGRVPKALFDALGIEAR